MLAFKMLFYIFAFHERILRNNYLAVSPDNSMFLPQIAEEDR